MVARGTSVRSGEKRSSLRAALPLVAALGCLATASAQGRTDYFNVETPVGQALAVARLANHDYLLVCNTPDNSVEVWDTNEQLTASQRFLLRIPVGLEPNSILWSPTLGRAYVTCFLGDSVTSFTLAAMTGSGGLTFNVDLSRNVGDEPMDLALTPNDAELLVSFASKSAIGAFNPATLEPIAVPTSVFPAPTDNLLLEATVGTTPMVIKEPRAIEISPSGSALFVLNHKGGSAIAPSGYDFGLYARTLNNGTVTPLSGLGTTNWNMRFASDGNLYVVGGEALFNLQGGTAVATAATGFVQSVLYRVENAGTTSAVVRERDLNTTSTGSAVTPADALTMPTDVVALTGSPTRLYVAAFGSDRVGVVTLVNASVPSTWTISRIAIPVATGSTNTRSGPRALVVKNRIIGASYDPGNRVYVLNRMDNSFSILASNSNSFVATIPLHQDPTPKYIRKGRPFLYSADLSGNGFDSCASCHLDGRTDSLGWNLGSTAGFLPFETSFVDSPSSALRADVDNHIQNGFTKNKGVMVTQSLQGLLDTEIAPVVQDLVTNAPYHWRGDKPGFTDFNVAFVDLLGRATELDPADMGAFEEFVNSIHYPPNPKQLETRLFSGGLGNPDTEAGGSRALKGMKLFHIVDAVDGRACVQCHALPRGSNLKFTLGTDDFVGITTALESAQLRGLFQREKRFQVDGFDFDPQVAAGQQGILSGAFGTQHNGDRPSINGFINLFNGIFDDDEQLAVNQFVHEFDWGVAPVVGREQRVVLGSSVGPRLDLFESQVELGNCGLAVNGNVASGMVGYWYDPTRHLYAQETNPSIAISRLALLALVTSTSHRLYFRCTPLGSERRIAALTGTGTPLSGVMPSNLQLLPMVTNTAWAPVPSLTHNWSAGTAAPDFVWSHLEAPIIMPTPRFLNAIRRFQQGLIVATNYGLTARRHDAPRRFRVAGDNILPGAKLMLWTPMDTSGAQPDTSNPPDPAKTRLLEFPLYATGQTSGGHAVWETAVELAPIQYYALMNGGIEAPAVRATLDDTFSALPDDLSSGPVFDPDHYNWHYVQVDNADVTAAGNGGWQQLTMQ